MKRFKIFRKYLLYIFFFFSIFDVANGRNLNRYYDVDKISKYFYGVLAFQNNEYASSYESLKELKGLEDLHLSFSRLYQYSLINSEKFIIFMKYLPFSVSKYPISKSNVSGISV